MTTSVTLLVERVVKAAKYWTLARREGSSTDVDVAERALTKAVRVYEAEEWRVNDAALLVKELLELAKLRGEATSFDVESRRAEVLRRAEAFIGQREVREDTTPIPRPRKGILRRRT